jgi:DNA-binding protein Fis
MKLSDLIIIMWHKGQITEGKAASLIGVDRLTLRTMRDALIEPSDDKSEKMYSTMTLVEYLHNALENGYEELGATDIGDLLLMCEVRPTQREPDDGDAPVESELSNDELDTDYQLWSNM